MEQTVGRRRTAIAYVWLMALIAALVVVQGVLFAGFYSEADRSFISAHGAVGALAGLVLLVVLIPLAFVARFPRRMQIGWWTVLLAVLWNLEAHVIGFSIGDSRWLAMAHIPPAIMGFGLGLYLVAGAYGAVRQRAS